VIVRLVDIGGIVDHHCSKKCLIITQFRVTTSFIVYLNY